MTTLYAKDLNRFNQAIDNVALWMQPQTGNSILLLNCRMINGYKLGKNLPGGTERSDFKTFNLGTRKVEWSLDSISRVSSVVNSIIVIGNTAIFKCANSYVYCLDLLHQGAVLWKVPTIGSDQIFDIPEQDLIMDVENVLKAIDPSTGVINWQNNDDSRE